VNLGVLGLLATALGFRAVSNSPKTPRSTCSQALACCIQHSHAANAWQGPARMAITVTVTVTITIAGLSKLSIPQGSQSLN